MKIKMNDFIQKNREKNIEILKNRYNLEVSENALFKAIFLEDMELIQTLDYCGISFLEKINNTFPLHFAAFRGNMEIFKFVYAKVKDIDLKTLSTAILNGKKEIAMFILKEIEKGQVEININSYVDDNFTPLSLSIMVDNIEVARKLLALGADVNLVERKRGDSPLMLAINATNHRMIKLLLESGANPNFIAEDGFTPLIVASYIGDIDVVKMLLKYNTDVFYSTQEGFDALKIAISNNKTEVSDYIQSIINN